MLAIIEKSIMPIYVLINKDILLEAYQFASVSTPIHSPLRAIRFDV